MTKLVELEPRWLEFKGRRIGFMFLCPHCHPTRRQWLTCFFEATGALPPAISDDTWLNGCRGERLLFRDAFAAMGSADPAKETFEIVSCAPGCAWVRTSDDFDSMSITPSIDANAAGHWHGFITGGQIQ